MTVEADRLRDLPLFSGLSNIEREYVAAWLETRSARPGDRVVAEGAAGYEFFIIEEGTAEVVQDGEGIRALGPGDFFGEMALVGLHAARTPSAARRPTPARRVQRVAVERFLELELEAHRRGSLAGRNMSRVESIEVRDNSSELRYELLVSDEVAGVILYRLAPGAVALIHTDVSPALEGRGLGARLVAGALDDIRARGLRVIPICPFVRSYIRRHPDYADLVVTDTEVGD